MKKLMTVWALLMCMCAFAAKGTREERIAALEEIVICPPPCSTEMRERAYLALADYYDDTTAVQEQKDRIAAYFLSRVDLEREPIYAFLDGKVCEMFPSYRHSQRRRDNLAAVSDPTLTGAPKEVYEARVRDAQPVEE